MGREAFRERIPEIIASLRQSIADFEATRAVMAASAQLVRLFETSCLVAWSAP
jgi:hypothetical protein